MHVAFSILIDRERDGARAWGVCLLPMTFVPDTELNPKYVAQGEVDWTDSEILDVLERLSMAGPKKDSPNDDIQYPHDNSHGGF